MGPLSEILIIQIALPLSLFILVFILFLKYHYNYWLRKGIPCVSPLVPWGHFRDIFYGTQCITDITYTLYRKFKSENHRHGGMFFLTTPVYMPIDPEYIKGILISDFEYFNERGPFYNEKVDPLASHLFNLPHKEWKTMRSKMSPTFTSGKLKNMFLTMVRCSEGLVNAVGDQGVVDINDISIRYTLDIIGSCGLGIESNSLKDPNSYFREMSKIVTNPPYWNAMKFFISLMSPNLAKLVNLSIMPQKTIQFFSNLVKDTIDYREKNNVQRNDFMQLMINMKNEDEQKVQCKEVMDSGTIAAQVFVFFAAGYETSSMTITLCLFELSQNMEVQERVRSEVRKVMKEHGGNLTYEGLMSMTYLDQVFSETLRKYPSLAYLNRMCSKQYQVPGTDVVLEKGTMVLISLMGLHRDPEYYENPEVFDPDRFSEENKWKIKPYTYLPFGEGHRNCIGARFGIIQTKICLAVLIANFKYTFNDKTELPIRFNSTSFTLSLKSPIYLNTERIME